MHLVKTVVAYVYRLQVKKARGVEVYYIAVPKEFVERLGLSKGSLLKCELKEINGKVAIVYTKVE